MFFCKFSEKTRYRFFCGKVNFKRAMIIFCALLGATSPGSLYSFGAILIISKTKHPIFWYPADALRILQGLYQVSLRLGCPKE